MKYIIIVVLLAIVFMIAEYFAKKSYLSTKDNTFFKNIQLVLGTIGVLVTGYYAYVKFIQEQEEKDRYAPVLNVRCKLEKVAESDTCYWLRATVSYENKSERRIRILFSSLSIMGFNITGPADQVINTAMVEDQNYYYSRDFSYYKNQSLLYSLKTQSQTWYDFNQFLGNEYIIKIMKRENEFDVAHLTVSTAIANQNEFSGYVLTDSIVNGVFTLNVYDTINTNNKGIKLNDLDAYNALKDYGYGWVNTECQLYLKEDSKK